MSDETPLERRRRHKLKHRYKITPIQFTALLAAQGGRCGVCRAVFDRTPIVDHDHSCCPGRTTCGKCVRGLLDSRCNRYVLPVLESNPDLVTAYLKSYLKRRPFA
jgi:hypothetical protein